MLRSYNLITNTISNIIARISPVTPVSYYGDIHFIQPTFHPLTTPRILNTIQHNKADNLIETCLQRDIIRLFRRMVTVEIHV